MKRTMFVMFVAASLTAACTGTTAETPATGAANGDGAGTGGTSVAKTAATQKTPTFREVTVPAGTALALELKSSVSSTSRVEDAVNATLRAPLVVDGKEVLPAGTAVGGHVTDAKESGRVKGRAHVAFRFTTLTHDGSKYDIATSAISRTAAATKGKDAEKIGIGAGAGAALGAILGGGSGAVKGAAIGGAAGTGAVLATKGKEVTLGPGANVATKLTAPLTVRVRVS